MIEEDPRVAELRSKFKYPLNGALYAYFEAPVDFLDTKIPNGAPYWCNEIVDPDTGEIEQVAKTLREYSNEIHISLDGTTALIKCQAKQADCGRLTPVTVQDIELWIQYLGAYGYAEDSLFGLDKRKELLKEGGKYVLSAEQGND